VNFSVTLRSKDELIEKMFKAMAEDQFVLPGAQGRGKQEKSIADKLYDNS